ncbi:rcc01693 family protein [Paracoccus spongiarum]|uniref:Phage tail assembly chaperone n=1 Tax=Paracoccus spongiarum TaxID=3064387 RepID=A0ABT9J796_9RHOB|nr:rcc01693 family protein [Paracoccus sp. 2205BS29-5]MDP5305651.1 phage tail assembly chaperone [Paracoccus sp. 2205BS29-5]
MIRSEARGGLDWPGLMRAGLRGLGLRPDQFWSLTPAELALMLGVEAGPPAMTRSRLAALASRFPDRGGAAREGNHN